MVGVLLIINLIPPQFLFVLFTVMVRGDTLTPKACA